MDEQINSFREIMMVAVDKNFEISQKSLMHNSVFCRLFSCRLTTQLPHYKYFSRSFARSEFVVALYQDQLDKYNILIYTSRMLLFSAIRSLSFLLSNVWKRKTVCRENMESLLLNVLQYFFFMITLWERVTHTRQFRKRSVGSKYLIF